MIQKFAHHCDNSLLKLPIALLPLISNEANERKYHDFLDNGQNLVFPQSNEPCEKHHADIDVRRNGRQQKIDRRIEDDKEHPY